MLLLFCLPADDVNLPERRFDQEAMKEYRADRTFDYSTEYAQSNAWLTMLMVIFFQKLAEFLQVTEVHTLFPVIFRILIFVLIAGLIYFLIKNKYGGLFIRESKQVFSPVVSVAGDGVVDYDRLIRDCLDDEAYSLAIRYRFLKTLHSLHELNTIKITPWKAPMDYLRELKAEKKTGFGQLVNIFESTWYGDYPADESVYQEVHSLAKSLLNE